mgnify:CR=1 FL=1
MSKEIHIWGIKQNNLKNIEIKILEEQLRTEIPHEYRMFLKEFIFAASIPLAVSTIA